MAEAVAEAVPATPVVAPAPAPVVGGGVKQLILARLGQAEPVGRTGMTLPVVFMDPETGQEFTATLTLSLTDLVPTA